MHHPCSPFSCRVVFVAFVPTGYVGFSAYSSNRSWEGMVGTSQQKQQLVLFIIVLKLFISEGPLVRPARSTAGFQAATAIAEG